MTSVEHQTAKYVEEANKERQAAAEEAKKELKEAKARLAHVAENNVVKVEAFCDDVMEDSGTGFSQLFQVLAHGTLTVPAELQGS